MPKLYLVAAMTFNEIATKYGVYAVYVIAAIVMLLWIILSFSKSRGLVNHHNAVALRGLLNFLRTTDTTGNQLNELYSTLTKNKNDVVLLFYMYCRIHKNFASIEHYLNYRTYKKINRKQKPWGYTTIVIVTLVATLGFSISHWVGFDKLFKGDAEMQNLVLSFACPIGLFLLWLLFRVYIMLKYKMYWVEFENMFRKINVICNDFFPSQEEYYDEFEDNILTTLTPTGGIKRRIEQIIAVTDPEDVDSRKTYKAHPYKAKTESKDHTEPTAPVPAVVTGQGDMRGQPMMPLGARIIKPHPETEAYLQAQAQITQQLMQMMMQQGMQQSQVVQRALTSQQALANTVAQQNIMALRLEAQQTALQRPEFGKLPADSKMAWAGTGLENPFTPEEVAVTSEDTHLKPETQLEVEKEKDSQEAASPAEAPRKEEVKEVNVVETAKPKKDKIIQALMHAFELLSPPPKSSNKEPDPIFVVPERPQTNVEKRLEQFFSAKVYNYDSQ